MSCLRPIPRPGKAAEHEQACIGRGSLCDQHPPVEGDIQPCPTAPHCFSLPPQRSALPRWPPPNTHLLEVHDTKAQAARQANLVAAATPQQAAKPQETDSKVSPLAARLLSPPFRRYSRAIPTSRTSSQATSTSWNSGLPGAAHAKQACHTSPSYRRTCR